MAAAGALLAAWSGWRAAGTGLTVAVRLDDASVVLPAVRARADRHLGLLLRRADLPPRLSGLLGRTETVAAGGEPFVVLARWTGGTVAGGDGAPVELRPYRVPREPVPGAGPPPTASADLAAERPSVAPPEPMLDDAPPLVPVDRPPGATPPTGAVADAVLVSPLAPAAPTFRRRDPVRTPLLPDGEWREWFASVSVGGRPVSDGALALRDREGRVALRAADLAAWRVRVAAAEVLSFQGEAFVRLDALGARNLVFDEQTQTLAFDLPASRLAPNEIGPAASPTPAPSAGFGGFFEYDVQALAGGGVRERLDALLETGVFSPRGVLLGNLRGQDLAGDGRRLVRLETTFQKDMPARRQTFRLGDSVVIGGAFGRPVRFAGLQWATDLRTDPSFVAFPLPTIGGLAESDSVVDVFVDNTRTVSADVPAGPFAVRQLPTVTGAGEVQLRVTDLLGRERVVTQSYYVSPRLLRAGLSEFAYEVGAEREDFGEASFAYGAPFATATRRYGLDDTKTIEGHAEVRPDGQMLALGGSTLLGGYGLVSGGLSGSLAEGDPGVSANLDYEYRAGGLGLGLRTTLASEGFRRLGESDRPPAERIDQASLGFDAGDVGRFGLFLVNAEERGDRPDETSLAASYTRRLGPGSLIVNGVNVFRPDGDLALTATYSLSLDDRNTADASAGWQNGAALARSEFRRTRGASDLGADARLAAGTENGRPAADASLDYATPLADLRLDGSYAGDGVDLRAGIAGGVAVMNGRLGATRRLGRAFGMVDLPGLPGVPVYVDNREVGRTDEKGFLMVPELRPYEANAIRLDAEDLPLDASVERLETTAVPFEHGGVAVAFGARRARHVLATLTDEGGTPLPAGTRVADARGGFTGIVAKDGLTYLTGAPPEGPLDVAAPHGRVCRLPTPLPPAPMARLGRVACR